MLFANTLYFSYIKLKNVPSGTRRTNNDRRRFFVHTSECSGSEKKKFLKLHSERVVQVSLLNAYSVEHRKNFFSSGPVCSSFSAEAHALLQALIWTGQHRRICQFSSELILSDSRSVLSTQSSPSGFLLPSTFWHELSAVSKFITLRLQ